MAEFQIFAWKKSDFDGSFATMIDNSTPLSGASITLKIGSEPIFLAVNNGSALLSGDATPVLTEDVNVTRATFPKGSKIEVVNTCNFDGDLDAKCFVCRIGDSVSHDIAISELFVFSTVPLAPNNVYNISGSEGADDTAALIPSFARGTLIDTPHGPQPIERLEAGDEVLTRDGGIQLIDRTNLMRISGLELFLKPHLRPVCIQAGALVWGLPGKDLMVTQRHRLLLNDWRAGYLFGEDEILVPSKSLLNGRNVTIECPETGIDYFQIGLDQQELISANGLWAETCKPDQERLNDPDSKNSNEMQSKTPYFYGHISDAYKKPVAALPYTSAPALAA